MHLGTRARVLKDVPATTPHHCEPAVAPAPLGPAWVIKACDCSYFQSCEHPTWTESLAHAVLYAIRESAIRAATKVAPWGITPADLHNV